MKWQQISDESPPPSHKVLIGKYNSEDVFEWVTATICKKESLSDFDYWYSYLHGGYVHEYGVEKNHIWLDPTPRA